MKQSSSQWLVEYSYIRRLMQYYLYLRLLDNLDSFNTLLCVLFLDHHNDCSALRPNLPGPMACSNKLCTGRVRWSLFSFSINLIDIPMLADFIFLEQVDQGQCCWSLRQPEALLCRYQRNRHVFGHRSLPLTIASSMEPSNYACQKMWSSVHIFRRCLVNLPCADQFPLCRTCCSC